MTDYTVTVTPTVTVTSQAIAWERFAAGIPVVRYPGAADFTQIVRRESRPLRSRDYLLAFAIIAWAGLRR